MLKLNRAIFCVLVFILVMFCGNQIVASETYFFLAPNRFRTSFELIPVKNSPKMGLIGLHYDLASFLMDNVYLGIGGYGALTGDRGGFFTAGISLGYKQFFGQLFFVDSGLFLGAGGGASAFPGSGLMIRPHLYLGTQYQDTALLLGVANETISNQDLGSFFSLGIEQKLFHLSPKEKTSLITASSKIQKKVIDISPSYGMYIPSSTSKGRNRRSFSQNVPLLGLESRLFLSEQLYSAFGLFGATSEEVDGYGKIYGGIGYQFPITASLVLNSELDIGMSGGGNIDTGGGSIFIVGIGLEHQLLDDLSWYGNISQLEALEGGYRATFLKSGVRVKTRIFDAKSGNHQWFVADDDDISDIPYQWFLSNKSYVPSPSLNNKNGEAYDSAIQLLGLGLDFHIWHDVFFRMATYWAWGGSVGAYAEGGFGFVYDYLLMETLRLRTSWELVAAGGGGMDVNQGLLQNVSVGVRYLLNPTLSLGIDYGVVDSFKATAFNGSIINLGITFQDVFRFAK